MAESDIPSALLTNSQRDYLRDGGEEPSNEYMMKRRIRERVFAGLRYDGMILKQMDPELRREIFRYWEEVNYESEGNGVKVRKEDAWMSDEGERTQFEFGLRGLLGFIYMGVEEGDVGDFWEILEDGIDRALRERGRHVEKFEPNLEQGKLATVEDVYEMLEEGELEYEDLTFGDIQALISSDLMEMEDFPVGFLEDIVEAMEYLESLKEKAEEEYDSSEED